MLDMAGNTCPYFVQNRHGGAYLSRRAIAALITVMFDESRLHRMKLVRGAEPLNRCDLVALMLDCKAKAGIDAFAINKDGACTALAVVASLLCAGKFQMLPQCIEKCCPGIKFQLFSLPVDLQANRNTHRRFAGQLRWLRISRD